MAGPAFPNHFLLRASWLSGLFVSHSKNSASRALSPEGASRSLSQEISTDRLPLDSDVFLWQISDDLETFLNLPSRSVHEGKIQGACIFIVLIVEL